MTTANATAPVTTRAGEGEALWWAGGLAVIKADSAQTGGRLALIEVTEAPGATAPLHVHHNEDEGFWVLDGGATFRVGEKTFDARPGDFVWGPRDVPHTYTAGPDGCRLVFVLTPGGFEDMVRKMSEPATSRTLPPPSDEPGDIDMSEIVGLMAEHGIEVVDG